jgi:anti-sigma factor RsiW
MKNPRRNFAFGSSQRNRMTLMFGAARFCEQALSASHSFGFRITPRGMRAAPRRVMRHKCFRQRWILSRASPRAAVCGSSAWSAALFRCHRHAGSGELPSVRRNAPEVCRKTR